MAAKKKAIPKKLAVRKKPVPRHFYSSLFWDVAKAAKLPSRLSPTGNDEPPDPSLNWGLWSIAEDELILDISFALNEYVARIQRAAHFKDKKPRRGPPFKEVEAACKLLRVGAPNEGNTIPQKELTQAKANWVRTYHPDMNPHSKTWQHWRDQLQQGLQAYNVLKEYNFHALGT